MVGHFGNNENDGFLFVLFSLTKIMGIKIRINVLEVFGENQSR